MDDLNLIFNAQSLQPAISHMESLINYSLEFAFKLISIIMYGVWSFVAIRIFMSA